MSVNNIQPETLPHYQHQVTELATEVNSILDRIGSLAQTGISDRQQSQTRSG